MEKILKAPEEIKVDKNKEQEAAKAVQQVPAAKTQKGKTSNAKTRGLRSSQTPQLDKEAVELAKKFNAFNGHAPEFILNKGILAEDNGVSACNIDNDKISTAY